MNLQDLFSNAITDKVSKEIAGKMGIDEATASNALGKVLPKLLGQVSKNTSTEEGIKSLDSAIEKGHNTSDINLDVADGAKILSHIMGGDTSNLLQGLTGTGLDTGKSNDLLALASSFVMENLGKAKNEGKIDSGNLGGIIKMGSSFLDKDGDGDIKDDIFTMIINFFKSKFLGKK